MSQIKSKTEQEIYEFYRCWKYTKYYRTWKLKSKDRPKHNVASLSDLVYHERQIWKSKKATALSLTLLVG